MKMPTVMGPQHKFSMVPRAEIERSIFDRSHRWMSTFDAGYLVPFFVDWALPGDTMALQVHGFCRLSTPMKPLMDNMYMETFFFAVPYRLIWANFVKMMGEQAPNTFTSYTIPITSVPAGGYAIGSLADYFGLPTGIACTGSSWTHSALPARAYFLIYDQWFRDENLIAAVAPSTGDGPEPASSYTTAPLKRGKRHDYFTSCLPWPQKNTTGVALPLGTSAPVKGIAVQTAGDPTDGTPAASRESDLGSGTAPSGWAGYWPTTSGGAALRMFQAGAGAGPLIYADLSMATGATINSLRLAFQQQKFLERDARGGTRYTEKIRAHFGVVSPDARLQRAEYLGGGSSPMIISPVAQSTAPTAAAPAAGVTVATLKDTAQGNLGAFGTVAFSGGHGFVKSFTEHCIIIGLVNVRADLTYAQGIDRLWSHSTIWDHYWPSLAHIGEQAVLNKEIYLADNAAQNDAVFGYQERYAEYRYKPSRITGLFRPTAAGTLSVWHLSESFGALPTLGQTFIEDQTTTILQRNLVVNTEPDIIGDFWFSYKCARPMPVYGVPGLIDHF